MSRGNSRLCDIFGPMDVSISVCRMVHYVLHADDVAKTHKNRAGTHIAAMVVGINSREGGDVNLTLFPDWGNDGFFTYASATPQPTGMAWKKSVKFDDGEKLSGTWHFPEMLPAWPPKMIETSELVKAE